MSRRLRILTWHVHGNYMHYLSQVPHDFHLVNDPSRAQHHSGRSGTLPWGDNVIDLPVSQLHATEFDVVLFQSRLEWDTVRHELLSEAQRRLPCVYIEHDPPQSHPTDSRHWVDDPNVVLVHVTHFNDLMWDSGRTPTRVIEHGVLPLGDARWTGHVPRGAVVVNHLKERGRRLGYDIWQQVAPQVPLALYGMGSLAIGGDGEIENRRLPEVLAAHRFFFHPIRWTSLGLAVIEAMMVGVPVVGLATTELVSVIRDGENGFVGTDVGSLVSCMHALLDDPALARRLGEAGRATACERFGIDRFVADWQALLHEATT